MVKFTGFCLIALPARKGEGLTAHAKYVLTLFVGVDAIVGVEFLVSLLLLDSLAKYCVSVDDVHWLFLLRICCHC